MDLTQLLHAATKFRQRVDAVKQGAALPDPTANDNRSPAQSCIAQHDTATDGLPHHADELQQLLDQIEAMTMELIQQQAEPSSAAQVTQPSTSGSACTPVCSQSQGYNEATARRHMEAGHAAMQQGQWAAALGCFLDAARESPNDLEVWTHVAVAAHKQGAHLVALQAAEQLQLLGGPSTVSPAMHTLLAHACEGLGRWQAAHTHWQSAAAAAVGAASVHSPTSGMAHEEAPHTRAATDPLWHLVDTSAAAVAAGLERCSRALASQGSEAEVMLQGTRPPLPVAAASQEAAAVQLQAAEAGLQANPESQAARVARVEALLLCGRYSAAADACVTLLPGWERAYCDVQAAVRAGQLAEAARICDSWAAGGTAPLTHNHIPHSSSSSPTGPNHTHATGVAPTLPPPPSKFTHLSQLVHQLQEEVSAAEATLSAACKPAALSHIEQALSLAQRAAPFPALLASLHCLQARAHLLAPPRTRAAHQCAARAMQLAPDSAEPLWLSASSSMEHDPLAALECLTKLQALAPGWPGLGPAMQHAAVLCMQASACSSDDDGDESLSSLGGEGLRSDQAQSSDRMGGSTAAVRHALVLLGLDPREPVTRSQLARAYRRKAAVHHPDRLGSRGAGAAKAATPVAASLAAGNSGAPASAAFLAVRDAYELLLGKLF